MSYDELRNFEPRLMSMGLALSWQAAQEPDRPALTMGGKTYGRLDLDRAANRFARVLAQRGIGKDDRVAVVLPTGPDHQIASFAAWKVGATVIPLPPRLVDRELLHLAELANPKIVIGADQERLPGFEVIPAGWSPAPSISDDPLPEAMPAVWKASCSGGSTGMPKLIWDNRSSPVHPEEALPILRIRPGDVMLHPAGAYHNASFTQTNWALCWGCHVILMERFDALEWLETVDRFGVNWAYMVPTMMSRVLALPDEVRRRYEVSSLNMVIHMAAPCPPWVKEAWIEWIGADKVWEVYGGTEGYGATMIGGVEWLAHRGSVGRAPAGTTIRNDEGEALPAGEIGTIYFTPPANNPMGHTGEPRTFGDVGSIDSDGFLYLADRRTDMIITGGVNLYPAEIEAAIEQWPGVKASAVIGLPDNDLGARAHAIIEVARDAGPPDQASLAAFLRERLSSKKIPFTCEFTQSPLRDEAGKLKRGKLREDRLEAGAASMLPLRHA